MTQYNVLVIPENHLESKRFQIPKFMVHALLFGFALLLTFTTLMTWGVLHYRKAVRQMSQAVSPTEEGYRSQLMAKMNQLEESLKRTQQFTSRVESMVGVDTHKMKIGVGPLSEQDDFSKYLEKISQLPRPAAMAYIPGISENSKPQGFYEKLNLKLDELSEFALSLEARSNEVYELGQDKLSYWASTPSIWPVKGWVTSDFGLRISPLSGASKFHEGLDIAAPYGSPIYAPSDGITSFTGYRGGYGYALVLDHGYGVSTLYGHTSTILVKEGQKINRGELIAMVGNSGASTGPHLHYEVHVDGIPTDPMKFLLK